MRKGTLTLFIALLAAGFCFSTLLLGKAEAQRYKRMSYRNQLIKDSGLGKKKFRSLKKRFKKVKVTRYRDGSVNVLMKAPKEIAKDMHKRGFFEGNKIFPDKSGGGVHISVTLQPPHAVPRGDRKGAYGRARTNAKVHRNDKQGFREGGEYIKVTSVRNIDYMPKIRNDRDLYNYVLREFVLQNTTFTHSLRPAVRNRK